MKRRDFLTYTTAIATMATLPACGQTPEATNPAPSTEKETPGDKSLEKVTFATDWVAQAEHGGFYQAIAKGFYRDRGLNVTIRMGGPGSPSSTQLLMGKIADFALGGSIDAIRGVMEGIPKVTIAALFQKDPRCLLAHPDTGIKSLEDLRGHPIYVDRFASLSYWKFLKAKYGFTDDQQRPYNFNPGPFLADKNSGQQGYITSEPFAIRQEGGFDPKIFLLSDYGYQPYSTMVQTRFEMTQSRPELVQRFLDATIQGWYSYLEDPNPANQLIREAYPDMSEAKLAFGFKKLNDDGFLVSGDAESLGIGAMTEKRLQSFYDQMVTIGVLPAGVAYQEAFTFDFVNQGKDAIAS